MSAVPPMPRAGWLAVPDRHQALAAFHNGLPCRQVRLLGGLDVRQSLGVFGRSEQFVIAMLLIWVEPIPVLLGGNHHFERSAKVQHRAREQLVRPAGQAAHPDQLCLRAGVGFQLRAQRGGDQRLRVWREASMASDPDAWHDSAPGSSGVQHDIEELLVQLPNTAAVSAWVELGAEVTHAVDHPRGSAVLPHG